MSLTRLVVDLLFPRYCLGCGHEGQWICRACLKAIELVRFPFCPECRNITARGEFCKKCRHNFKLDGIIICADFEEGILREAIHELKYEKVFDIAKALGLILAEKLVLSGGFEDFVLMPVPLHKKRQAIRGFNQAEILANVVSSRTKNILSRECLRRVVNSKPQMELKREDRLRNLEESFCLTDKDYVEGKKFLLVDDITTTGATLNECAKMLKKAGALEVWGLVLAKGK